MSLPVNAAWVGVASAALVLAVAAPAAAHNYVVESTPAEGEVLTALPDAWEVVTNDILLYADNDAAFGLWARDADGLFYGAGCVTVDGRGMSAEPVLGAPGDYTLVYSLISADGHPLSGEIPFEWAPTGETDVATGSVEPAHCGALPEPPDKDGATGSSDAAWIAGATGVVLVAVIVAVLLARRAGKRRDDPTT